MKKVTDTKNPTVKQLRNISENLRNYLETYASITVTADFFRSGTEEVKYGIYIEKDGKATHRFKTWLELLSFYHKLMKEEV